MCLGDLLNKIVKVKAVWNGINFETIYRVVPLQVDKTDYCTYINIYSLLLDISIKILMTYLVHIGI